MKTIKLTDVEATILHQILVTVEAIYNNSIGHGEWTGDETACLEGDQVADEAVDNILRQLEGPVVVDEEQYKPIKPAAEGTETRTKCDKMFNEVKENNYWNWIVDDLTVLEVDTLIGIAELNGWHWCYDLGDNDDGECVNLLIIEKGDGS